MNKIILPLLLLLAVSCTKSEVSSDVYYLTMPAAIEVTDLVNNKTVMTEFEYTQYDNDGNIAGPGENGVYKYLPVLYRQHITGDSINLITYVYREGGLLDIEVSYSDAGVSKYTFSLNDKGMADSILVDGKFVPYKYIQYDENGMRTKVGNCVLESEDGKYTAVRKEGDSYVNIEYDYGFYSSGYSPLVNVYAIQQVEVPGHPYFWCCDAFGLQSKFFYKKVRVSDEGNVKEYYHNYLVNSAGQVVMETIYCNNEKVMEIKYSYYIAVVDTKL